MKNNFLSLVSSILLIPVSTVSQAIEISLSPTTQQVSGIGTPVNVAVNISGLDNPVAASLGAFDFDVGYNPAILGFNNASYGDPKLGDQLNLFGLGSPITNATAGNGKVNLFAISLNTADELKNNQADKFTLATLTFQSLSAGKTDLSLTVNALSDENGSSLSANVNNASVSVAEWLNVRGANQNGQSVGRALDQMRVKSANGQGTTQQTQLRTALAQLPAAQLPTVATELAGEIHGAMAAAAPEAGRWLQGSITRQLAMSTGENEEKGLKAGNNVWVDFNVSEGHANGGSYANAYTASRYQFAVGVDILHSQNNRLGIGATYATTRVSPHSGIGNIEETAPFIYGQYVFGEEQKIIVDGMFSYAFNNWETDRADPLRNVAALKTKADGENIFWSVGVRSPFILEDFTLEPFARVLWQNSSRDAVSEGNTSISALSLGHYSMNGTRTLLGATFGSAQTNPLAALITYRLSLAFGNDFGGFIHPTVQASLADENLTIYSPRVGHQFGQLNLSATYRVFDNAYYYLGVIGEARSNRLDGGVNAGFSLKF